MEIEHSVIGRLILKTKFDQIKTRYARVLNRSPCVFYSGLLLFQKRKTVWPFQGLLFRTLE